DYTFAAGDAGTHSFSATLYTTGLQSLTAADAGTSALAGSQTNIYVISGASSFSVAGFPDTTAGTSGTITVSALDADGNLLPGYLGTVHFSSSDPQAVLPADYSFTADD